GRCCLPEARQISGNPNFPGASKVPQLVIPITTMPTRKIGPGAPKDRARPTTSVGRSGQDPRPGDPAALARGPSPSAFQVLHGGSRDVTKQGCFGRVCRKGAGFLSALILSGARRAEAVRAEPPAPEAKPAAAVTGLHAPLQLDAPP